MQVYAFQRLSLQPLPASDSPKHAQQERKLAAAKAGNTKVLSSAYRLSASHILFCAQGKDAFVTAAVDVFQFTCKDVGQMQMLRIGHNNTGASPDWHLDKVSCSWLP